MGKILIGLASILLSGCMGMPENVNPVEDFNLNKYLGKWYEIARFVGPFYSSYVIFELYKTREQYT